MDRLKSRRAVALIPVLCASLVTSGCQRESKVEQIRRGMENVHHHAQEIKRESQSVHPEPDRKPPDAAAPSPERG
jgi:hypothetical protein